MSKEKGGYTPDVKSEGAAIKNEDKNAESDLRKPREAWEKLNATFTQIEEYKRKKLEELKDIPTTYGPWEKAVREEDPAIKNIGYGIETDKGEFFDPDFWHLFTLGQYEDGKVEVGVIKSIPMVSKQLMKDNLTEKEALDLFQQRVNVDLQKRLPSSFFQEDFKFNSLEEAEDEIKKCWDKVLEEYVPALILDDFLKPQRLKFVKKEMDTGQKRRPEKSFWRRMLDPRIVSSFQSGNECPEDDIFVFGNTAGYSEDAISKDAIKVFFEQEKGFYLEDWEHSFKWEDDDGDGDEGKDEDEVDIGGKHRKRFDTLEKAQAEADKILIENFKKDGQKVLLVE